MTARPWREPIPVDPVEAWKVLQRRVPLNASKFAELADRVSPLRLQEPATPEPRR